MEAPQKKDPNELTTFKGILGTPQVEDHKDLTKKEEQVEDDIQNLDETKHMV